MRTLIVGSLLLTAACFAGRTDPAVVPVPRIAGVDYGDTLFVMRSDSYLVMGHHRSDMPPATVLNDAAREFRLLFEAVPPQIMMAIGASDSTGDFLIQPIDTVYLPTNDAPTSVAPREGDSSSNFESRRMAYGVARAWMRAVVDSVRPEARDAVLPAWFEEGSALLVAYPEANWHEMMQRTAASKGSGSLAALFGQAVNVPAQSDGILTGIQGAAFLAYLRERDPKFVASMPSLIAQDARLTDALVRSDFLPHDLATLEREWREWYGEVVR